jgi:hypothetical protein
VASSRLWLRFLGSDGKPIHEDLPNQQFANGFLAWAPDGRRLAGAQVGANGQSALWIIEPDARAPYRKLADLPPTSRPRGLTWTSDGSSVIVALQEFASDIVMFDVSR